MIYHSLATLKDFKINPTLEILKFSPEVLSFFNEAMPGRHEKGNEFVLVWREAGEAGELRAEAASNEVLLALKMVAEGILPQETALTGGVTLCSVHDAMREATRKGILLKPVSRIRRDIPRFCDVPNIPEVLLSAEIFTIQWHVTNACDLQCKHCYDRTKRSPLTYAEGIRLLDGHKKFCNEKHVWGHVCFSGGNPFMSPHFLKWYRAAADRGFATSVLGNPVPREKLEKMLEIQMPRYFQVSLEGLREHNDFIRGKGFFTRVMDFLVLLKEKKVSSAVMLTLTKDNLKDVLALAERLRTAADYFTFNRLSARGEGAKLACVSSTEYALFLKDYIRASEDNPVMGFKDNLINVTLAENGDKLFSGCSGHGCGAAFNFVSILPDGEVHACQKFSSPIGNIITNSLLRVYDSAEAKRYREGTSACRSCALKPRCGGCLAVTKAAGLDIFTERDPYCLMSSHPPKKTSLADRPM
ncbi:MAG: thio(seleno)oxazole modification radical SAM maturase SbtM [Candidatus Omnitrophota bacterium]